MSPRNKLPFYKRQYIINPRFQLTFAGYTMGFVILANFIFYLAETMLFWDLFEKAKSGIISPEQVRNSLDGVFLLTTLFTSVALGITGILVSNKIAGPLYRLRKHMLDVTYGKSYSEVNFRKGDFFNEVADAFNKVTKRLESEITKNKSP